MSAIQQRLGDFMTSRRKKGEVGLPTLSVTLDRGLVRRDSLDRKTDTNLEPGQHLRVLPGDIAYNMMRMWQGASGLAETEAIVSPAYVVLAPKPNLDPRYAAYLFKTARMIHSFWAYSYGLTNDLLRLYPNDALKVPVAIPPLPEQQKIADILSTWDRAIEATESLLATARTQKRALMQSLLTGKRRFPEFEGQAWKEVRLGDVARVMVSNVDKKTKDGERPVRLCNYTDVYKRDTINPRQSFMEATATAAQIKRFGLKVGDVIITKDSETADDIAMPTYVAETADDLVCGYHLAIVRPGQETDGRFLKFFFELPHTRYYFGTRANGAIRFGLTIDGIEGAKLQLPPIDEQRRIAGVIADTEAEISRLVSDIEKLRVEKKALMQQLLTGKRRVVV